MCMLTLISEKGKLIMLIKKALAYGNKSVTLKHFQKQVVRFRGEYIKGETSLNKPRTSDTLIGYLPIFQMLPKISLHIRYHWHPFEKDA